MALIKNATPDDLVVPELGDKIVEAGGTIEVPDDQADRYTSQQGVWETVKQTKKKVND